MNNSGCVNMADITFEIKEKLGALSDGRRGWTKEINLVSWNNAAPKLDIREWTDEHDKMGKGVTLTKEEARKLYEILDEYLNR